MDSRQARPIIREALVRVLGREPTLAEIYVTQALARYDGGYGTRWSSPPHGPEAPTANNWGAVQDRKNFNEYVIYTGVMNPDKASPEVKAIRSQPGPVSPKPSEFFYASDYSQKPGQGWFWGPYKAYPSAIDGAEHVARILERMGVLEVANTEKNWMAVSRQLKAKHYYGGYHKDDPERDIRDYARNLARGGTEFEKLFGEKSPLSWDSSPKAQPTPVSPSVPSGGPPAWGYSSSSPPSLLEPSPWLVGSEHDVQFPLPRIVDRVPHTFWIRVQGELAARNLYLAAIDGDPGPLTMRALARVGLDALK